MSEVKLLLKSARADDPTKEIGTFFLRYPRMIHSEFMTHRDFSRNASSSRAIPTDKLVSWSSDTMHMPKFRKNKKGMQPGEPLSHEDQCAAELVWERVANDCLNGARELADLGVHKQWANRMLEWFGYINVTVTSTRWSNFFALRTELNEDGYPVPQDEIYHLAVEMKRQLEEAEAQPLLPGEWHTPWIKPEEYDTLSLDDRIKVSVARSASTSYLTVDGQPMSVDRALALNEKLLGSHPIHASPAEHQATPRDFSTSPHPLFSAINIKGGNLGTDWVQYRKLLPNECL